MMYYNVLQGIVLTILEQKVLVASEINPSCQGYTQPSHFYLDPYFYVRIFHKFSRRVE